MKLRGYLFIVIASFCVSLKAEPAVYGKLWITVEHQDTLSGTEIDMVSNASRLGAKGSMDFGEGLEAIYQVEYEVDLVDGTANEKNGRTFKQRNSFVGIKGSYGTLFLGTHDTATKRSIAKIDLFNDLAGDIKNILQGENRMNDFIGYTTPTLGKGLSATFNTIKGTEEEGGNAVGDSTSMSLNYKTKSFYTAISFDTEVKGYDTTRVSLQVPFNGTQIGIIYQDTEELSSGLEENGYVLSLSQKIGEKGVFKIQLAESDMKMISGKQTSIGYDYKLSNKAKFFFFFTDLTGNKKFNEKEISALGFEYKF